jgi:hypothetical protein
MAWAGFSTPGANSASVIVIIIVLMVAAYGISTLLDKRKAKKKQ